MSRSVMFLNALMRRPTPSAVWETPPSVLQANTHPTHQEVAIPFLASRVLALGPLAIQLQTLTACDEHCHLLDDYIIEPPLTYGPAAHALRRIWNNPSEPSIAFASENSCAKSQSLQRATYVGNAICGNSDRVTHNLIAHWFS
mmetsp:Transcript_11212/g.27269  ORF Transcript_11212/g.27269 Transcript_11212/m.27269 type:complete len:143 (+) Transcript_11212:1335-1763(+)